MIFLKFNLKPIFEKLVSGIFLRIDFFFLSFLNVKNRMRAGHDHVISYSVHRIREKNFAGILSSKKWEIGFFAAASLHDLNLFLFFNMFDEYAVADIKAMLKNP